MGVNFSQHKMSHTPVYSSWRKMKERCYNPAQDHYEDYGGRGIKVCSRWLRPPNGFQNFLKDMGERPLGMTLDRINNDKGYSPENCRWATHQTQTRNSRIQSNNTSGIRGVCYSIRNKKWEAYIYIHKKRILLGRFQDKLQAIKKRKLAERQYWGQG